VAVPSSFHADWLAHKLGGRVRQALERTGHGGVRVAYDSTSLGLAPLVPPPAVPVPSLVAAVAAARPLACPGRVSDDERPRAADMSHLVVGCPACCAASCRCSPVERTRWTVVGRTGSMAVAGRAAP